MAYPTITLEVAFTTDPGAAPTWTDISAYLEGEITISRGRSQETEKFRAGTLDVVLQNEDRRFDPANTAGAYYPNVVPMRRVRVRAVYSAVTYDLFNGYVDGWEQSYDHPSVAHCRLSATDAFKVLSSIVLPSSAYAVEVRADSPVVWYRMGEPSGASSLLDSVGTNHLPITSSPTLGAAGLVVREVDTAALFTSTSQGAQRLGTATLTGPPMTFEMIYKNNSGGLAGIGFYSEASAAYTGTIPTAGWVVEYQGGFARMTVLTTTASGSVSTTTDPTTDAQPHHIAFTWAADGTLKSYFDGVNQATTSVAVGTFVSPAYVILGGGAAAITATSAVTGTYDEIAVYSTALSAARILAHSQARATAWSGDASGARIGRLLDAAGWPAADRTINTGVATLQGADLGITALEAVQKVEETERGRVYVTAAGLVRFIDRAALITTPYITSQATFGDSGSELEYADITFRYDDSTIANEVVVSRSGGSSQTVRDATSITKYLKRSKVIDGLLHTSDATSIDLANWELAHYKDPLLRATRVKLEPDAGNDATHFPVVLTRELVDRVTARRRPQGVGAAIDQETHIESVTHRMSRGVHWTTEYNLSPADTQTYGVWDVGLWDTARWSF